jgi:hypothetical protein
MYIRRINNPAFYHKLVIFFSTFIFVSQFSYRSLSAENLAESGVVIQKLVFPADIAPLFGRVNCREPQNEKREGNVKSTSF